MQHIEVALGNGLHISVPGIETLVHRQLTADNPAQFLTKHFSRNPATLEVAEDAVLVEGIKVLTGIMQADFLEPPDGILVTQGDDHTTKIERDVMTIGRH